MRNTKWVWVLPLLASMAWGVHAQQLLAPATEVRGKVEQWAPGANVIKVDGKTYPLAKGVQVLNQRAGLLANGAVRSGGAVLLQIANGEVTHVVVNPGKEPVMDQPQK